MYLESTIIPFVNSNQFIVIHSTSQQFSSHQFMLYDSRYASIKKYTLNNDEYTDLTAVCTLPLHASEQTANDFKSQAKGQLDQTKTKNLSETQVNRYKQNYRNFMAAAELATTERVHLPISFSLAENNNLLLGFVDSKTDIKQPFNQNFLGTLSLIDTSNGEVIKEQSVKSKSFATNPRHHAEFIAYSHFVKKGLFHKQSSSKMGLFNGKLTIVEKSPFSILPTTNNQNVLLNQFHTQVIPAKNYWVAFIRGLETCCIKTLEYNSGRVINEIELDSNASYFDFSDEQGTAVIAHQNGTISIVNLNQESIVKIKALVGIEKDSWIKIKISQDAVWTACSVNDKDLYLFNTHTHEVFSLPDLKEKQYSEEPIEKIEMVTRIKPAFAFVNNILVVDDNNGIQKINPNSTHFEKVNNTIVETDLSNINRQSSLLESLTAANLLNKKEVIEKYHSPAIRLSTKPCKKSFVKPKGKSQFGGWPDLPKNFSWPMWENRPMSFLAQINLEEMHQINPGLNLPPKGLIYFFLGCSDISFERAGKEQLMVELMVGCDKNSADGFKVIYTDELNDVQELRYKDSPKPMIHECCHINASIGGNQLPDNDSTVYQKLNLAGIEVDNYNELLSKLNVDRMNDEEWDNLLMGYPQLIQMNPPELFCERAKLGLDPYGTSSDEIIEGSAEWTMILQLTSDINADFLWGDGGHFYFYSNREKAKNGDFSDSWVYFEN